MKLGIVVHEAEEGGFWAEIPAIRGCATQGDSIGRPASPRPLIKRVRRFD